MTKISVIIPTHNRAALLWRAIESAKNAGTDVEIVVVDDASADETEPFCRNLAGIVYLRMERNVGLARARNAGIKKSTGEYIAFLDDDDLRLPNSLDPQAAILAHDERLGFVYGQVHIGDSEKCLPTGEIRPTCCPMGDIFWQLVEENFIYVASVMVRRRDFEAIGLFSEDVPGTEDWDAWLRLAAISRVGAVREPVGVYREASRQSAQMSRNRRQMCTSLARTQTRALHSPRAMSKGLEVRRKIRSKYRESLWYNLIKEGDIARSEQNLCLSIENYLTAIKIYPRNIFRLSPIRSVLRSIRAALWN